MKAHKCDHCGKWSEVHPTGEYHKARATYTNRGYRCEVCGEFFAGNPATLFSLGGILGSALSDYIIGYEQPWDDICPTCLKAKVGAAIKEEAK